MTTEAFTIDLARSGSSGATPTSGSRPRSGIARGARPQRRPARLAKQLLREVWGPAYEHETHYLRVYVAQLRRKLEPDPSRPRYLLTEPGMGYRFES